MRSGWAYWMHFARGFTGIVLAASAGQIIGNYVPADERWLVIALMLAAYFIYPKSLHPQEQPLPK